MTNSDIGKNAFSALSRRQQYAYAYYIQKKPDLLILEGAVRSGKTYVNNLIFYSMVKSQKDKGYLFIMSGATKASLERNVLYDFGKMFDIDTHLNQKGEFKMFGNIIVCFGTDKIDSADKVKGLTAMGWYANEITKHHIEFIKEAISRCSLENAKMIWDTNPDKPSHYVHENFISRSGKILYDGIETIKSIHFELDDNPVLTEHYKNKLKALTPETSTYYKRNILGLWVASGNVIFDNFKIEKVSLDINQYDEILGGMDFGRGGNSESAFVLIGRQGKKIFILAEVKALCKTNNEFIPMVQFCMDNIKVGAVKINTMIYADPSDPDKITEFSRAGFHITKATKGAGSVLAGIELLQATDWTINENCTMLQEELQGYEWQVEAGGQIKNKPVKVNDHLIDSVRMCLYSTKSDFNTKSDAVISHGNNRASNWKYSNT